MEVRDLRNIRDATLELGPGLNVLYGNNAQGKTSVLEAMGLLARGRSFRTEETLSLIRRGAAGLHARGLAETGEQRTALEVELCAERRHLRVDGREVAPRAYHGRLEVVVYSTDRLRVVRGPMRERRQYVDRSAAALWPVYRQTLRDYERVVQQRNAALERGGRDLEVWDERLVEVGAGLRQRRAIFVERLSALLAEGFCPAGERYEIALDGSGGDEQEHRRRLRGELGARQRDERRVRRSLVGPHRDPVWLKINGEEASGTASSGQSRSLLLALALATLEVYRRERGAAAVALLDDLDSELDEERASALCREVAGRGQALVTTAHRGWARRVGVLGRLFEVEEGRVSAA